MNQNRVMSINAYEYGIWEIHVVPNSEYVQVYKMKGRTGSFEAYCDNVEQAMGFVYDMIRLENPDWHWKLQKYQSGEVPGLESESKESGTVISKPFATAN